MPAKAQSQPQPLLSILIPACNFAYGVRRIVLPLLSEKRGDIEILVHDDSSNDSVGAAMHALAGSHPCLRYVRNSPALGAVANWNSLLRSARGRYVILIHHDDFPLSERFAADLLDELERKDWPDALVLSRLIYDVGRRKMIYDICNPLRRFIVNYLPAYLLRRNPIGPPSVLVVRRDLFEGYDPTLKWLVDVEAYFRFLTAQKRRLVFSDLTIICSTGSPDSITTEIWGSRGEIADAELAYLETKYARKTWGTKLRGTSLWGKFLLLLEWPMWAAVKATSAICSAPMSFTSLPAAVAHRNNSYHSNAHNGDNET